MSMDTAFIKEIIEDVITSALETALKSSLENKKRKRDNITLLKQTRIKSDSEITKIRRKAKKLSKTKERERPHKHLSTKKIDNWWTKCANSVALKQSKAATSEEETSAKNTITYTEFCQFLDDSASTDTSASAAVSTSLNTSEENTFLKHLPGGISPVAHTTTPVDRMHTEDKMNADEHE